MNEPIFANGFRFQRKEKAPDFVIGRLSMKADEAKQFIDDYAKSGWVNCDIKQSKSGNYYIELDTWEPTGGEAKEVEVKEPEVVTADSEQPDLPF